MAELLAVLIVLGILLGVVTLVGHGIWVFLAWIFRGAPGGSQARPSNSEESTIAWKDRPNALQELRRQLDALVLSGSLDDAAYRRLLAAIAEEERRRAEPETVVAKALNVEGADAVAPAAATKVQPAVEWVETGELTPVVEAGQAIAEPAASLAAASEAPRVVEPVAAPVPLGERAKKYAASRQAAANADVADVVPSAVATPVEPAVPMSRLFAAFMEENNIRWGELVGGLLIVGCSVALVISLWSQIAGRPLLQFLLFNGVTAAIFGVGVYTDRWWKIHTTSRGLLVIATLLVPLNFLALAAFTQAAPPTDLLPLAGEVISLIVFALLVYIAGRTLVPNDAVLLVVGVMVPCLMQLLVRRFATPGMSFVWLYALAAAPVVAYLATSSLAIRKRWSTDSALDETEANRTLLFVGLVSAAVLMPLALMLYYTPLRTTLHWLSPVVAVCGLPALLVGLLFWRRLGGGTQTGLQTAGVAVGALGAMLMAAAVVLAWPDPATLVPTALLMGLVLLAVAAWFGIPAAHVPAGVAIAVAALIAYFVFRGQVGWTVGEAGALTRVLLSAMTGKVLIPLVAVFGGVAWWLRRIGRGDDSFMYGLVTAASAAASLALVLWFGFGRNGDPQNITWILVVYALGALAAGVWLGRVDAARAGSVLLLAALVQAIMFRYADAWQLRQPLVTALLTHSVLTAIGSAILAMHVAGMFGGSSALAAARRMDVLRSLLWLALATSVAAAGWLLFRVQTTPAGVLAIHLVWLAAVWMLLAGLMISARLFTASQVVLVLAIFCGVTAAIETRDWYAAARHPWLDPWFVQAQVIAIAGYCLIANLVRWWIATRSRVGDEMVVETRDGGWLAGARRIMEPEWPTVAQVAEVAIVVIAALVATYAVVPGVARELSPTQSASVRIVPPAENFQIAGALHTHAAGRGAWATLAVVVAAVTAGLWQRGAQWRVLGLAIVAMAVCPLLASRWDSEVAVASALRWISAGFFAVVSAAIWVVQAKKTPAHSVGDYVASTEGEIDWTADLFELPVSRLVRDLMVAFVVLVYVGMGVFVIERALALGAVSNIPQDLWPWVLGWGFVAAVVGLVLPYANVGQGDSDERARMARLYRHVRDVLLLLAAAPIAILVTFAVAAVLERHPIAGPVAGSFFRRIGFDVSYGVPLAVIALVFIGWALRDQSSRFVFAAGMLFNVVATMVVLLRLARGAGALDRASWILVAQVNAIVAGVVGIVWAGAVTWWRRRDSAASVGIHPSLGETRPQWPLLLVSQVAFAAALCGTFLAPAVWNLLWDSPPAVWAAAADGAFGWSAVAQAAAATGLLSWRRGVSDKVVGLFVAAVVALAALTVARTDTGNWETHHTLLLGNCAAACALPFVVRVANRLIGGEQAAATPLTWTSGAGRFFQAATVFLAFWGFDADPSGVWWAVAALVAMGALCVWIAWREARRRRMWLAALLFVPAASIAWLDWGNASSPTTSIPGQICEFLWANVWAVTVVALLSVWIERRRIQSVASEPRRRRGIGFHRFGVWAMVVTLVLTTFAGVIADYAGDTFDVSEPLAWLTWVAVAATGLACVWDPAMRFPVACLYCIGLVAVGMYLDSLDLRPPMFYWALANALAAYSLVTSGLWSVRERIGATLGRLSVPVGEGVLSTDSELVSSASRRDAATMGAGHGWLVPANLLVGVFVLLLVVIVELSIASFVQRIVAAYAVGAQAFAIGLLARGRVRTALQYMALVWGVLFAVAFSWAFLPTDFESPWLHRLVLTVVALTLTVVVYGFALVKFLKRENEWTRAAMRLVPTLAVLTVGLVLAVVGVEVFAYMDRGVVNVAAPARLAIGVALVGLIMAALAAALLPGRDPLGLSERGRTAYVYAAEGLAALLFVHIRVTMPWLFHGWFLRFWPLIVMVIAFVGVGLGEVFQRRQRRVLSEPLNNTGALLPLLPVIGFWFVESRVNYSLLLLSIGVLYASLSVLRKSMLYGALAALAANGSLWYLLHDREGLGFLDHPQLWLIPPALSALIAGYINRERLSKEQSAALRYVSAIVIYVSSTVDIFINGVAEAPWLPAVLAGLSILGVLAGIMLRVRAFLYLGLAFLVVALLTIIWHAGNQYTWIWWVAGIVTGALIIAAFGLIEKRRDDVRRALEELRHWQS